MQNKEVFSMKLEKKSLKDLSMLLSAIISKEKIDYFFKKCNYENFRYDNGDIEKYFYCKLIEINDNENGVVYIAKIIQILVNSRVFFSQKEKLILYAKKINKILHPYNIYINNQLKIAKKAKKIRSQKCL